MPATAQMKHNVPPELLELIGGEENLVPIEDLKPHPENARRGDVDFVRESLREHGQYRLAVVQRSTGFVCVGNHMLQAAALEEWTHLAAVYRDLDDHQARRLRLADNRAHDKGGYDQDALLAELENLRAEASERAKDADPQEIAAKVLADVGFDQMAFDGLVQAVRGRDTGAPAEPPSEFRTVDDDLETDYACPHCGYEWSGLSKPTPEAAE